MIALVLQKNKKKLKALRFFFFFLVSNIKILLTAQNIGNVQKGKNIKKPNYNDLATQEKKYNKNHSRIIQKFY